MGRLSRGAINEGLGPGQSPCAPPYPLGLVQAIARVNRPYEDEDSRKKPAGFVLDFVGVFDNLEKAPAFDSEDVKGVVQKLDVLRERFAAMMAEARRDYLPVGLGLVDDKRVETILEFFRDQDRR